MQFLLHSTQHVATREELEAVKRELKQDISRVEDKISTVEINLRQGISKVEDKISTVEINLRQDISKVDAKFDKIQWLIIATMMTVLFKDYIMSLIQ